MHDIETMKEKISRFEVKDYVFISSELYKFYRLP